MKIQEDSKDFAEEGIMFPSSKISYVEENTLKGKENMHFSTGTHSKALRRTRRGANALGAHREALGTCA